MRVYQQIFVKALDRTHDVNYKRVGGGCAKSARRHARHEESYKSKKRRRTVSWSKKLSTAMLLASTGLIAGCFSSNPADIEAYVKPYEVNVTAENYVLQPPDEIEIHCTQVPEVHLQRQRIRPDGKVSFEGIGEVDTAGKTPAQVANTLKEKIAQLYSVPGDHPVDVRISAYGSKVIYVMGQVGRPGPMNYTGRDSVLTALAATQPNQMAWKSRIQVVRPAATPDVDPKIFEVNLNKMMIHGDTSKDVLLQEGDIVYVPPTILAAIGMVLEEFISPIARAFYGAYLIQNPPISSQGYYPTGGGGGGGYWGR
jgi:polysaccharide export outer membrane protein